MKTWFESKMFFCDPGFWLQIQVYAPTNVHGAIVADVEKVHDRLPVLPNHVAPVDAAADLVRGRPHQLRVVPNLVQVVGRLVSAVGEQVLL
jgi:hypothetical protein